MKFGDFVEKSKSELLRIQELAVTLAEIQRSKIPDRAGRKGFDSVVLGTLRAVYFDRMLSLPKLRHFLATAEEQAIGLEQDQRGIQLQACLRALTERMSGLEFSEDDLDDWDHPEPFDPSHCG